VIRKLYYLDDYRDSYLPVQGNKEYQNTNTTNSKAVVDPLNPGGTSYVNPNPYKQSTVRDLFVGHNYKINRGLPILGL
jgi:hypothetical protein